MMLLWLMNIDFAGGAAVAPSETPTYIGKVVNIGLLMNR